MTSKREFVQCLRHLQSMSILVLSRGDCVDVFYHTKPVYGLGVDPSNDNIFATAGEDGRVLLFDLRASNDDPSVVVKYRSPFHSVMFHPIDDHFMITANAKEGAALWDNRAQRMPVIRYGGDDAAQSCMSVRFNSMGTFLLALRRRLPPILYSTLHRDPICQFYNPDYYNSCTMKSCSFAGASDEFVLSGSDDFNLYVWKVSDADRKWFNFKFCAFVINFKCLQLKSATSGLTRIKWCFMGIVQSLIRFATIRSDVFWHRRVLRRLSR